MFYNKQIQDLDQHSRRLKCIIRECNKILDENKLVETKMSASYREIHHLIYDFLNSGSTKSWHDTEIILRKIQEYLKKGIEGTTQDESMTQLEEEVYMYRNKCRELEKYLCELQQNSDNRKLEDENNDLKKTKHELNTAIQLVKKRNRDLVGKKLEQIDRCGQLQNNVSRVKKEREILQSKIEKQEQQIMKLEKPKKIKKFNS